MSDQKKLLGGYHVEPAANGGWIVRDTVESGYLSELWAFSSAEDLVKFLSELHFPLQAAPTEDLSPAMESLCPHDAVFEGAGEPLPDSPTEETIAEAVKSVEDQASADFDVFSRSAWSHPETAARAPNGSTE